MNDNVKHKNKKKVRDKQYIETMLRVPKGIKIKRNITTAKTASQNINFETLSTDETKSFKEELLREIKDLKIVYNLDTNIETVGEFPLEDLNSFVKELRRDGEISRMAKSKENTFFGVLSLGCLVAKLANINSNRIHESQLKNRNAYYGYFYGIAIVEYES